MRAATWREVHSETNSSAALSAFRWRIPSRTGDACKVHEVDGSLTGMAKEILQVRDVPTHDVEVLRARAAARNMSLSSYLRELIHDDTSRPTIAEVLKRITARDSIEADPADIRAFIETDRR